MTYNDFPILDSLQYELINKNFKSEQPFNRRSIAQETKKLLTPTLNIDLSNTPYNSKIITAVSDNLTIINKLSSNLDSLFATTNQSNRTYKLNIFQHLINLFKILESLNLWLISEEKEYYKSFLKKSIKELFNSTNNILLAIEKSNVKFFKYM